MKTISLAPNSTRLKRGANTPRPRLTTTVTNLLINELFDSVVHVHKSPQGELNKYINQYHDYFIMHGISFRDFLERYDKCNYIMERSPKEVLKTGSMNVLINHIVENVVAMREMLALCKNEKEKEDLRSLYQEILKDFGIKPTILK